MNTAIRSTGERADACDQTFRRYVRNGPLMAGEQRPPSRIKYEANPATVGVHLELQPRGAAPQSPTLRRPFTVRWLSMSTFPIRDGVGNKVVGYVSCAWDITESTAPSREFDVLNHASHRLSASLIAGEVVRALTEAATDLASAPGEPRQRAQLYQVQGRVLTLAGETDPDVPVRPDDHGFSIADHPYMARAIATAEPVVALLPEGGTLAPTRARHASLRGQRRRQTPPRRVRGAQPPDA